MKSDHIWLAAFACAAILTGGIWWVLPTFPWWAYGLFWLLCSGVWADQWMKLKANEKIIDRGDWPTKEPPSRP